MLFELLIRLLPTLDPGYDKLVGRQSLTIEIGPRLRATLHADQGEVLVLVEATIGMTIYVMSAFSSPCYAHDEDLAGDFVRPSSCVESCCPHLRKTTVYDQLRVSSASRHRPRKRSSFQVSIKQVIHGATVRVFVIGTNESCMHVETDVFDNYLPSIFRFPLAIEIG